MTNLQNKIESGAESILTYIIERFRIRIATNQAQRSYPDSYSIFNSYKNKTDLKPTNFNSLSTGRSPFSYVYGQKHFFSAYFYHNPDIRIKD